MKVLAELRAATVAFVDNDHRHRSDSYVHDVAAFEIDGDASARRARRRHGRIARFNVNLRI